MAIDHLIVRLLDAWGFLTPSMLEDMADRSRPVIYKGLRRLAKRSFIRNVGFARLRCDTRPAGIFGNYYALTHRIARNLALGEPPANKYALRKLVPLYAPSTPDMLTVVDGRFPLHTAWVSAAAAQIHTILYQTLPKARGQGYGQKGFFLDSEADLRRAGWYSPRTRPLVGVEQKWLTTVPDFRIRTDNRSVFVEVELTLKGHKRYISHDRLLPEGQRMLWLVLNEETAKALRKRLPEQRREVMVALLTPEQIKDALLRLLDIERR